ncbi:MAG TPA: condensation domain-containing protein [Candidatus Tectomicrobia bacterium]|nr:condensation domain-containing protein [Candidatus Tectomicrobia bacterium]
MSHPHLVAEIPTAPCRVCIPQLLAGHAEHTSEAPAILAPARAPLSYGRLRWHIDTVIQALNTMGLGRHDRIALVLPNGPEMAVAFLAVAAGATCVPLNPAYGISEFDAYLPELHVKAVIVQAGLDSPVRAAAHRHGLSIIELAPVPEAEAGIFVLTGDKGPGIARQEFVQPDDLAVVMPTSGTTAWPRLVPLTHATVCSAALAIGTALALVESDRLLSVLPLYHSHGLISTMLASLLVGASVVCTPGFDASRFFAWMAEFHPTWYSAVPAIHQAILARAALNREIIARCPLRFIRSSSAALAPQLLTELETAFDAPVIEIYGMTEASTITCNPLPPRRRKSGSVGVAVGSAVAIMAEGDTLLPAGETGEIVVRGVSVMQGYDNDPSATRNAFARGWFKTGDQGFLDADGYLFITGRLKELINRGGEKIAPQEVDDVLVNHPAVAQAATFAVPDARLGEEIVAAVVLHPGTTATAREIRQFVTTHLADFKVPRQVLIVQDIPRSPTGKLQRRALAEQFGLTAGDWARSVRRAAFIPPRTLLEEVLTGLWAQVLELERMGIHDNFFELGGDSLLATQLLSRVQGVLHIRVSFRSFFEMPTVVGLASSIEMAMQGKPGQQPSAIEPVVREHALVASIAQEQMWVIDQLLPGMPFFNVPYALRLTGECDSAILQQGCDEIIRRHEALRTTFAPVDGQLAQIITPTLSAPLTTIDLRALPRDKREDEARRLAEEDARQPFNLAQGPLLRLSLLRMDEQEHVLILIMHHIISDGWSKSVFAHELAVLYDAFSAGEPSPLPELSIQYADFAHWQRHWQRNEVMAAQLVYWQQQLHDPPPVLELPMSRPRRAALSLRTGRQTLVLPGELSEAAKSLGHREGSTLFMTVVAAFNMLLYGYTGQEDLHVATLIANRNRRETEELIGLVVNTVILRTDLGGNPTCREVLQRVRETTLAAYAHQDLPFEHVVQALECERGLQRTSLCQVMVIFQNAGLRPLQRSARTLSFQEAGPTMRLQPLVLTTFDVILMLQDRPEELMVSCIYKTDRFAAASITGILGDFRDVFERFIMQPEQPLSAFRTLGEGQGPGV